MEEPLLTVRDLSVELKDDAGETELLRNYEFNISQGIVQSVSRFFDALALMNEAPPARGESGKYADSARGGVMGFGRKRNVCNQEKSVMAEKAEKERIQKEAEEAATAAALKATEQDTKMAALEKKVAEMQALAAPSLQLYALSHPRHTLRTLYTLRALRTLRIPPLSLRTPSMQYVPSPPLHHLRPPQELAARGWWTEGV